MKRKLHFVVLAMDGSIASTVFGPIELVQACRSWQAGIPELDPCDVSTEIVSPDGATFLASTGYRLPVDGGLRDLPPETVVFIPGFGLPQPGRLPSVLKQHLACIPWIKRQYEAGITIAGSCTGNFLLAEAGLLKGRKATTYWVYGDLFRERYPNVELDLDASLIENERVFSVGGVICGLEGVLAIIERFVGKEFARLCTKMLVLENRPPSELRYEKRQPTFHDDSMVESVVQWIREHLHARITLQDVLRHVPTSRRNLSRRFRLETGESVQSFIQRLRIDRAKLLLETSAMPVEQILDQIGYQDTSAFGRRFKQHTTLTPNQYRERYGLSGGVARRNGPPG
jgi:transcriptional regulator GlxA family with amidase domain